MLRARNTFVLRARRGLDERLHALTLNVNIREQDLSHFNGQNGVAGSTAIQRVLEALDGDEGFQALIREMDGDLRQLDQLVKTKAKEGTKTIELPDMTVQWQVSEEPGLHTVLQRVKGDEQKGGDEAGQYRPLPMREKLVVAVWMYPPHVEIPPTGQRIPVSDESTRDFFIDADVEHDD
ncbi:hypothetical protein PHYBOEH_008486 [Phytophthora boehmeriae]|uniref:Uncharacterized protein n=1 Tax=Phytophthora boehmeriae TaxID=109152 RepID=A0A8T1X7I6_9STRA|nr:hypothetical protein PHYBOEH_008486 [Phytophthora boehmeriae]